MGLPGREMAYHPDFSALERLYIKMLGVPVNGLRIRLAHVMPAAAGKYRRILDAGCGRGTFAMELAKAHPESETASRRQAVGVGDVHRKSGDPMIKHDRATTFEARH